MYRNVTETLGLMVPSMEPFEEPLMVPQCCHNDAVMVPQ